MICIEYRLIQEIPSARYGIHWFNTGEYAYNLGYTRFAPVNVEPQATPAGSNGLKPAGDPQDDDIITVSSRGHACAYVIDAIGVMMYDTSRITVIAVAMDRVDRLLFIHFPIDLKIAWGF